MRLTLIALLLAGVAGCGYGPPFNTQRPVGEPKLDTENGGDEEPQPEADSAGDNEPTSDFEASQKAAEQGHAWAQNNLGLMYDFGYGVPQDYVEAYAWTSVAATNGHERAKERLPKVKAKLTPEQLTAAIDRIFELINANEAD